MRKVLLTALALCTMGIASAQMNGNQARVYAYGLEQAEETGTVTTYTLTFKTNTAATEASVNLKDANGDVKYTVPAVKTDDAGKAWEAVVDVYELNKLGKEVLAGDYTWEATVSAEKIDAFTEIMTPYQPYRTFGLAVNTNPETDNFGTVYMTHQYAVSGRMANGIYAYNPLLVQTNYKSFDFIGDGGTAGSGSSPRDMNIAEDGRLFVTNYEKAKSNVYWIAPDLNSSGALFGGTLDSSTGKHTDANGDYISGLCSGIAIRGGGENAQLYVTDHSKGEAAKAYVMRYDIGDATTWTKAADWELNSFVSKNSEQESKLANGAKYSYHAMEVTKNGFWVAAFRGTPTEEFPDLFYYNEVTGNRDFISIDITTENTVSHVQNSIGLAVNERLGLLAYTVHINGVETKVYARVLSFKEVNDKMTVSYVADYDMSGTLTKKADALAFDYAGNLYAVTSGNERFTAYALPIADNTCTTPAKASFKVKVTNEDILTGVEDIAVDANAPVEYYNLQGVKVENPSNGIFIKKQGTKATKVVL